MNLVLLYENALGPQDVTMCTSHGDMTCHDPTGSAPFSPVTEVFGSTIHLSQRLESMCPRSQIACCSNFASQLREQAGSDAESRVSGIVDQHVNPQSQGSNVPSAYSHVNGAKGDSDFGTHALCNTQHVFVVQVGRDSMRLSECTAELKGLGQARHSQMSVCVLGCSFLLGPALF